MVQTEIIEKVQVLLNEYGKNEQISLLSDDTLRIEDYVVRTIPDAVRYVQQNSRLGGVNLKSHTGALVTVYKRDDGTGYFYLPDDYVQLRAFQMKGWKRLCTQAFPVTSPVYAAQQNLNTRAGKERPVCIENRDEKGRRTLEYYSIEKGEIPRVSLFLYDACYRPEEGLLCDDDRLSSAVCYRCAGLVFLLFENQTAAAALFALADEWMNNNSKKEKEK